VPVLLNPNSIEEVVDFKKVHKSPQDIGFPLFVALGTIFSQQKLVQQY
jgi:hypothetical protein